MRIRTIAIATSLAALSLVTGTTPAVSQSGGPYNLAWSSLDCGSPVTSAAGSYSLRGTMGQADASSAAGGPTATYALRGGFWNGSAFPTDAPPPDVTAGSGPLVFRLHGNAPNPFSEFTAIAFSLASEDAVDLRVFDLAGRVVANIVEKRFGPGRHQVMWDGRDDSGRRVAHGIYVLRLRAGEFQARRKLALVP